MDIRDMSTEFGKNMWEKVDRAADKSPCWMKEQLERVVKETENMPEWRSIEARERFRCKGL